MSTTLNDYYVIKNPESEIYHKMETQHGNPASYSIKIDGETLRKQVIAGEDDPMPLGNATALKDKRMTINTVVTPSASNKCGFKHILYEEFDGQKDNVKEYELGPETSDNDPVLFVSIIKFIIQ